MIYRVTIFSPVSFFRSVLAALYPPRCLCCGELVPDESPLCPACRDSWRAERRAAVSPRPDRVLYLAPYTKGRSAARTLVLSAKRSNERRLYVFLAGELAKLLAERAITADYIVNVPRSPAALRKTGVDQARLLAQALASVTGSRYIAALRHRHFSAVQKTLDAAGRAENAASAYMPVNKAARSLTGSTVILIDDIATTGATLAACEKLLLESGAARVVKAAVASSELA